MSLIKEHNLELHKNEVVNLIKIVLFSEITCFASEQKKLIFLKF